MNDAMFCTVVFQPMDRAVRVPANETVLKAARIAGVHINSSCGGSGACGKCRVLLEKGRVEEETSSTLGRDDRAKGFVQACMVRVVTDCQIRIPVESGVGKGGLALDVPARHRARMHLFKIEDVRQQGIFLPPVEKLCLELPAPSTADNTADAGRLIQGLKNQYNEQKTTIPLTTLRKLRQALREKNFLVTVTIARPVHESGKNIVVDVQAGNWSDRNFALAVDIGTTTIYGNLIDLHDGRVLASLGDYNGQIAYGEDVISRIIHGEKGDGLATLHRVQVETINKVIAALLKKARVHKEEISSVTLAGNTTMTHFLLELEPNAIRRAPYVPVSTFYPPVRALDIGLDLAEHAVALVYPCVSSYVGGDIVAGVMGSGLYRSEKLTMYLDIGTNAELVIGNREWMVCAACSAGPAFEGGGITHGMRAAAGAIEDFSLDPVTLEPMNMTIGSKPPVGICGSGLLIIIAALFERGVVGRSGKFSRELQCDRIRQGKEGMEYVLAREKEAGTDHDIVINEVDIANFIRAKAAIFAGAKTLLESVGLAVADLEQVVLAGAFGSYIDLDSAFTVGLLPEVPPERILYVGNGSLLGAWMSAMSNHVRRDVVEVVRRMTRFELSEVPAFHDQFTASLFLPHTDGSLFPATTCRLAGLQKKGAVEK